MKRTWLKLAAILTLCVGALHAAGAVDRPYSMLYVFGDSYSDTGAG